MNLFFQACGAVMIAVILKLTLATRQDMATLLTLAVCSMAAAVALSFIGPVLDFMKSLENLGNLDHDLIQILFKAAGIGVLSEIAVQVCADSGNSSMGKTVHLMASSVILWMSLPLFTALTELIQTILGEL